MDTTTLDLGPYCDNLGISASRWPTSGGFNIWNNTFPAEQLPPVGGVTDVHEVPFAFPAVHSGSKGTVDNLRCRGQRIAIPPGRYDWVYALAAAERRTEDRVAVRYHDGTVRRGWLRVSDFWPETGARFGEVLAFRCASMHYPRHVQENMAPAIWRTRMALPDPGVVVGLDLPDNPALHIFALTLVAEPSSLVSKED